MTNLARVVVNLNGWDGAPGVNVLHFSPGVPPVTWSQSVVADLCNEVVSMHEANRPYWAPGVTIQLRPEVDIIDSDSGQIIDQIVPSPTFGPITSEGASGAESRASQILVRFRGDKWSNGRRIAGRMFFGPIGSTPLTEAGLVNAAVAANLEDSFTAMISGVGPRLAVYSRPNGTTRLTGDWTDVTAVQVAPRPAVLRSRRD